MNSSEKTNHLKKVQELRESLRPENFDEWVCLAGDYRDMTEVQEWGKEGEKEQLLEQYLNFQQWMKDNPEK